MKRNKQGYQTENLGRNELVTHADRYLCLKVPMTNDAVATNMYVKKKNRTNMTSKLRI